MAGPDADRDLDLTVGDLDAALGRAADLINTFDDEVAAAIEGEAMQVMHHHLLEQGLDDRE